MTEAAQMDCNAQIAEMIARAFAFAKTGKMELAVNLFALTREIAVNLAQPAQLNARLMRENGILSKERYVTRDRFRANLDTSVSTLRQRGAGRIMLATIILPPVKFWPATPGINQSFASYNLEIMDVANRHKVHLLDLDRLIWEAQHRAPLLPDGMHLSDTGHQIMANNIAAL